MIEILEMIGKQDLIYHVKYACPSNPDAKYIVFMYPSTSWIEYQGNDIDEFNGAYTVSSNTSVIVAGFIHASTTNINDWYHYIDSYLYVNGNTISHKYVPEYSIKTTSGALNIAQYFQHGTTHSIEVDIQVNTGYVGKTFFIIAVITT